MHFVLNVDILIYFLRVSSTCFASQVFCFFSYLLSSSPNSLLLSLPIQSPFSFRLFYVWKAMHFSEIKGDFADLLTIEGSEDGEAKMKRVDENGKDHCSSIFYVFVFSICPSLSSLWLWRALEQSAGWSTKDLMKHLSHSLSLSHTHTHTASLFTTTSL